MNRLNTPLIQPVEKNLTPPNGASNMKNYNTAPIIEILNNAKSALVVIPQLNVDSISSGLALALALKKKGLNVSAYCPQKPDQNYQKLSGLELLTDTVATSDLVVSLSYPLDQIDAVSYNDDGGKLNLVVKTKANSPKIENNQIEINNSFAVADVCFMLGDETSLPNSADLISKGNWVMISPQNIQRPWAKTTLVDPDAPFSEIFSFLIPMLGLGLDLDTGKNLLIGLRVATQSFSINVSPETFEAGAINLRATQPVEESMAQPSAPNTTPIESVEKTGGSPSSTNQPNPTSTI